jgi:hypothetical protein
MVDEQRKTKFVGEKTEDFKVVFADGTFTWLGTETGTITFFYDVMPDQMVTEEGVLELSTVKRVFPVEIRLRRSTYNNLINFMIEQVKIIENFEKSESEKKLAQK